MVICLFDANGRTEKKVDQWATIDCRQRKRCCLVSDQDLRKLLGQEAKRTAGLPNSQETCGRKAMRSGNFHSLSRLLALDGWQHFHLFNFVASLGGDDLYRSPSLESRILKTVFAGGVLHQHLDILCEHE
jgi:hypothetical protein